jgi:hypothetical protein
LNKKRIFSSLAITEEPADHGFAPPVFTGFAFYDP